MKAKTKIEKELNKELKMLKGMQKNKGSNVSMDDYSQEEQALLNELAELLPAKYIRFDLVQAAANGIISTGGIASGQGNIAGQGTSIQQAAASRVVKQIQAYLDNYSDDMVKHIKKIQSENDQTRLMALLDEINASEQNFLKNISNLSHASGAYDAELKSLQSSINSLISKAKAGFELGTSDIIFKSLQNYGNVLSAGIAISGAKGDLGEAIANIAGRQIGAVAGAKVEQAVTEGMLSSNRGVNTAHFTKNTNFESLLTNGTQSKIGDFIVTSQSKQDKVDVSITLQNKKEINLSVKTYDITGSSTKIKFEAANLIELLQNENGDDFINHYLNLNAIKGLSNSNAKKDINNLIKKIVMAKIIAGYNYETGSGNMKSANYFVVIDNKNYTAKAYTMKSLLDSLINSGRYSQIKLPLGFIGANQKQPNISTRLNNVMKVLAASNKVYMNVSNSDLNSLK